MPAWVRRCLAFACLLATWLVVHPAAASAPMCDERGASMLAPMPTLDTPDASLDVGFHSEGCDDWTTRGDTYERGGKPRQVGPSALVDAVLTDPVRAVPPAAPGRDIAAETRFAERPGVRFLVERPPR